MNGIARIVLACALTLPAPVLAQQTTGTIAGPVTIDYVRVDGRDLNLRLRPNAIVDGRRYLGDLPIQPNSIGFRTALSKGTSRYDALVAGVRRRLSGRLDLNASYTLAKATSDVGTAYDEIVQNLVQDVTAPFAPVQDAPSTRTDARHRVTVSASVEAPWGLRISPIFFYRSALPTHSFEGRDLNADRNLNDKTATAYRFTGLNESGAATFEEAGACETVNCSRRASFSQLNLRVSRSFPLWRTARVEAIAEIFNLFNSEEPLFASEDTARVVGGRPAQLLHAANGIRRRLPAARAACRTGRYSRYLLIA